MMIYESKSLTISFTIVNKQSYYNVSGKSDIYVKGSMTEWYVPGGLRSARVNDNHSQITVVRQKESQRREDRSTLKFPEYIP